MTLLRFRTAVVLAAVLTIAGCSSDADDVAAARAALAPVQEEVTGLPGVVSATVDVQSVTGIEDASTVDVSMITEATTMEELHAQGRAAVEAVWTSGVPGVERVTLRVRPEDPTLTDADGQRLQVLEHLGPDDLEATYGPRAEDT